MVDTTGMPTLPLCFSPEWNKIQKKKTLSSQQKCQYNICFELLKMHIVINLKKKEFLVKLWSSFQHPPHCLPWTPMSSSKFYLNGESSASCFYIISFIILSCQLQNSANGARNDDISKMNNFIVDYIKPASCRFLKYNTNDYPMPTQNWGEERGWCYPEYGLLLCPQVLINSFSSDDYECVFQVCIQRANHMIPWPTGTLCMTSRWVS